MIAGTHKGVAQGAAKACPEPKYAAAMMIAAGADIIVLFIIADLKVAV